MKSVESMVNPTCRSKSKAWTDEELNQLRKENTKWLVIEDKVYDVTQWIDKHPGGDLIIEHFLYKDATDQFSRFHPKEVSENLLKNFQIGVLDNKVPIKDHISDFRELEKELIKEGYFETNYTFYILENLKGLASLLLGVLIVIYGPNTYLNYILGAFLVAFCWHQMSFVAHDAGHNAISHNLTFDTYYGIFLASCLSGLSIGWWKDSHNVHHVVTNDPEHDPDIQLMPFLAISEKFFDGVKSTYHKKEIKVDFWASCLLRMQHYLYYLIMMFGRFNLYVQSINFILFNSRGRYRKFEFLAMTIFLTWYVSLISFIPGWKKKLLFIVLTNAMTFLLHVQITLSHFAMSSEKFDEAEDFVTHQMKTSMDVECPPWLDWLHGGLQFQVIHHLFPRMPRHNYREARKKIVKYFEKHNLKYHCYSFTLGNVIVLKHLAKIANALIKYSAKNNN